VKEYKNQKPKDLLTEHAKKKPLMEIILEKHKLKYDIIFL